MLLMDDDYLIQFDLKLTISKFAFVLFNHV